MELNEQRLVASLEKHEGYRDKAYQDTEGVWTIGYGTNLQELRIDESIEELTAGGRSLEALFTQVTAQDDAADAVESGADAGPGATAQGGSDA